VKKVNDLSKQTLKLLLEEVLEQLMPADAASLAEHYRSGRCIGFRVERNSRGVAYKTAFQPFVEPKQGLSDCDKEFLKSMKIKLEGV